LPGVKPATNCSVDLTQLQANLGCDPLELGRYLRLVQNAPTDELTKSEGALIKRGIALMKRRAGEPP
jgi:hypothetical protein